MVLILMVDNVLTVIVTPELCQILTKLRGHGALEVTCHHDGKVASTLQHEGAPTDPLVTFPTGSYLILPN